MIPSSLDASEALVNGVATGKHVASVATGSTVDPDMELIFLGTGTSSSIPHVDCLTAPPTRTPCRTCLSTLTPEGKKNIRRNTSAVVRIKGKDGQLKTLVIDVGKNFQAAALEWFPKYGLREIHAVLITHAHADAMNGLDDLRGWTLGGAIQKHIDIYVSQTTFFEVQRAFPYLVSKEFASGGGDVPDFKWHIIEDKVPFEVKNIGVRITPFLVHHGRLFTTNTPPAFAPTPHGTQPATPTTSGRSSPFRMMVETGAKEAPKVHPYLCFGFLIEDRVVYMSDVSLIPEDAWAVIQSGGQKSVLVIDCLRLRGHTSHMGVRESAGAIRRIGARRSYLIGFSHDVSHEEFVTIGKSVGETKKGGDELSGSEKQGIEMMREGMEDGNLNVSWQWVRPSHDGLVVYISGDGTVRDGTYDG